MIIGAQRAGTTSLYDYLVAHPKVVTAKRKEVHYFDLNFTEPLGWYRDYFPGRMRAMGKITGEASPYYMFHPAVAERVRDILPEARFIVLLRDPIERAFSHYHHERRLGTEPLSFEQAIDAEPSRLEGEAEKLRDPAYQSFAYQHQSYVARGRYSEQLEHWFATIGDRERFLVVRAEDLFEDTGGTFDRVVSFLGLEPFRPSEFAHRNLGGYADEMEPGTRAGLRAHFAPYNAALSTLLGNDIGWDG